MKRGEYEEIKKESGKLDWEAEREDR